MKACSSGIAAHVVLAVAVLLHLPSSGWATVYEFDMRSFRAYPIGTSVNDIPDWESQGWFVEQKGSGPTSDNLISYGRSAPEQTWDKDTNYAIWSFNTPPNEIFTQIAVGAWCYTGLEHEPSDSRLYISISGDKINWHDRKVIQPNSLVPYIEVCEFQDLQYLNIDTAFYIRFQNNNQLAGGVTASVLNAQGRMITVPEPSLFLMLISGMGLCRLRF